MNYIERVLRYFEKRKQQKRLQKELDKAPVGPFPMEVKGEATKTFENLQVQLDRVTEEKRRARTTVQRIIDLLKEG